MGGFVCGGGFDTEDILAQMVINVGLIMQTSMAKIILSFGSLHPSLPAGRLVKAQKALL